VKLHALPEERDLSLDHTDPLSTRPRVDRPVAIAQWLRAAVHGIARNAHGELIRGEGAGKHDGLGLWRERALPTGVRPQGGEGQHAPSPRGELDDLTEPRGELDDLTERLHPPAVGGPTEASPSIRTGLFKAGPRARGSRRRRR
jgi:hypothetical protein